MSKKSLSMLKIRISYISLLVFTFIYSFFFEGGLDGFKDGWNRFDKPNAPTNHPNTPWLLLLVDIALIITFLILGIKFFVNLYHFINTVGKNKIFEQTNIERVTKMGWFSVLLGLILFAINYLSYYLDDEPVFKFVEGFKHAEFEFWPFLLGLVLLTIGYSFKKGLELKEENDLTV